MAPPGKRRVQDTPAVLFPAWPSAGPAAGEEQLVQAAMPCPARTHSPATEHVHGSATWPASGGPGDGSATQYADVAVSVTIAIPSSICTRHDAAPPGAVPGARLAPGCPCRASPDKQGRHRRRRLFGRHDGDVTDGGTGVDLQEFGIAPGGAGRGGSTPKVAVARVVLAVGGSSRYSCCRPQRPPQPWTQWHSALRFIDQLRGIWRI